MGTRRPHSIVTHRVGRSPYTQSRTLEKNPSRCRRMSALSEPLLILNHRQLLWWVDPLAVFVDQIDQAVDSFGFRDIEFHRCLADV